MAETIPIEEFREYLRELVRREVEPRAKEADEKERFPAESFQALAQNDLLGVNVSPDWGGMGLSNVHYAVMIEELARGCRATAVTVAVHTGLVAYMLETFGTPQQKERYLPKLVKGEIIGAFSLTEPQAGSDAAAIKTRAEEQGDKFVLNGTKIFCTSGSIANLFIVFAVTDPEKGKRGISAFLVERDTPGFSVGKVEEKMGWRGSPTTELVFEDAEVPAEAMLGERGGGLKLALTALDTGRIGIAAMGTGVISKALDLSVFHARERIQFGKPIGSFQGVQWMIADMARDLEAARLLTYHAAQLKDQGKPFTKEAAIAKLFATEAAVQAAVNCVQIHGGYGYTEEYEAALLFRDAKVLTIVEGTSEIQRLVIARQVLGKL